MPNNSASRRKSYYRTLSLSLFITTFPLLLLAGSIYIFGTKSIEKEASIQFERYFSMIVGNLDNQLQEIEKVGFQWGFNKKRILGYMNANFPEEFMIARSFEESLSHISTLSPLINECYFWSVSQPAVIQSDSGSIRIDKETVNLNITNSFYKVISDVRKIQWRFSNLLEANQDETILLFIKVPILMPTRNGLLILEIDKVKMIRLLVPENNTDSPPNESVILFDHNMNIIASRGDCGQYYVSMEEINNQIRINDSGLCVRDGNLFFYQKIKNKQWTAMSIMPMDKITKPVSDIARIIIVFSLLFLLASVILSYMASQSFYKPIKKMIETIASDKNLLFSEDDSEIDILTKYLTNNNMERKNLNRELAKYKNELRATIFNQLINGDLGDISDSDIRKKMKEIGIDLAEKKIGIIIVQLLEESYKNDHKAVSMLRFTAISVLKKSDSLKKAHIIPCREHMIAIIVSIADNVSSPESKLWFHANDIKDALANNLNIHTTVAMSEIIHNLSMTHISYNNTLKTLAYRKINKYDQIIDANRITSYESEMTSYPFHIERELLHAIQMGWKNEVDSEIENFFDVISSSQNMIFLVHQQIRLLISNVIFTIMQSGFDPWGLYGERDLYEELKRLNQLDSIKEWLRTEVIYKFVNKINELQDIEYRRIVKDVNEIIDREYGSPLLSQTYCSELLNTYPQKICVAFKKIENNNFLSYLTDYRLNKSKEMLRHSELSINSIAEQVGYQPSYFNRVFKKNIGVTPGEYRKNATVVLST